MFTVLCPGHGARVLIWSSGVDAIVNHDGGIDVHYHCTCGHRGVWRTGRAASEPRASRPPAPRHTSSAAVVALTQPLDQRSGGRPGS